MNRRDAIGRVALLMGGAVIGAEFFVSGCKSGGSAPKVADLFLADNVAFLDEVADTILPTTSSPGAKAAQVGHFMAVMRQAMGLTCLG
ncbi:MAG: gluconate 2-dehydrogenase subunit 3 family protein, partial [Bacteroidota bacterium]